MTWRFYKIHEVIDPENNNNCTIPSNCAAIHDYRSATMEQRTLDRKQFDLGLLIQELNDNPDLPFSNFSEIRTNSAVYQYLKYDRLITNFDNLYEADYHVTPKWKEKVLVILNKSASVPPKL